MKDIAKKIYPNRKIVKMDLRFGDRLNERLVGNSENVKVINKEIIKIQDCWGI
jgi:hypothetical protein